MAHDSFEEDMLLAGGSQFSISQAQAAEWHTRLVIEEKENKMLRNALQYAYNQLENLIPLHDPQEPDDIYSDFKSVVVRARQAQRIIFEVLNDSRVTL